MVFKMCRNRIRRHIVCRMLNRSKRIDFLSHRKHHDTSRMLSGGTPDSHTSLHNPVNFTVSFMYAAFFIIIFHITKCSLICKRTNRSGSKSLSGSKNNLGIFVRLTLIVSGKVKIDIRLFISLKSKESFKRNVKSIFFQ